jgi:DNA-binding beta-propeller fold protein YncE
MKDFTRPWGKLVRPHRSRLQKPITALALTLAATALLAPPAQAALGYEPDGSTPSIALAGEAPHGVAIDQANQRIYVAVASSDFSIGASGLIHQLESTGTPTAASPFSLGDEEYPTGVAVNPLTHDIYAAQFISVSPVGNKGSSKIVQFSSAGVLGAQFATTNNPGKAPQIATDASGNVYFPSDATKAVQVFDSAGTLKSTITCAGCTDGAFTGPSSVAVDSAGNVYVVDPESDRVVKFTHSGASYTFASELQSGRGAAAVAVDPSNDSVFVGDLAASSYHIVAYDSNGVQFDDFGEGLLPIPSFGPVAAGQIAVNATTHTLYVSETNTKTLRVFDRVTINPPSVSVSPASSVGQVSAKLGAAVNANLHATTSCRFEYTDDADFEANGYASATQSPCSSLPGGSKSVALALQLSDLTPATKYHYRLVAANNAGTTTGSDVTFTTTPVTPATVTTEAPSVLTETNATLTGKVNPHGGAVSDCHFEYGPGPAYGMSVPCGTAIGVVTSDVREAKFVGGLSPNTTYHYRLVVTSNAGTVNGNDVELTTPAVSAPPMVTPPVTQPVVPPVATPPKPLKCKKGYKKKKVRGKLKCVKVKRHTKHRS